MSTVRVTHINGPLRVSLSVSIEPRALSNALGLPSRPDAVFDTGPELPLVVLRRLREAVALGLESAVPEIEASLVKGASQFLEDQSHVSGVAA